ncbi:hypothetical protein NC651_037767 [Populus alba x Populus x berolinensis]|nr:hypothetical protein NC651_037767 [Populus alba x Populus x berolinensis]
MMILMLAPTYAKEEAAALLLHHLQAIALSQENVHAVKEEHRQSVMRGTMPKLREWLRYQQGERLGAKLSETVKGKLRLGAKITQHAGTENVFKQEFGVGEGEELLKASQCYLSTTAGPTAGLHPLIRLPSAV